MKLRLSLLALLALVATPVQGSGGAFGFGADIGHVHNIGMVMQGAKITVNIATFQVDMVSRCPIKASLLILKRNNSNSLQRMTFARDGDNSQIVMPRVRFTGDAVLFIQSQNNAHICFGATDVVVDG